MVRAYQIRKTQSHSKGYKSFGITIPAKIAQQFSGVCFNIEIRHNSILLQSGATPMPKLFEVIR